MVLYGAPIVKHLVGEGDAEHDVRNKKHGFQQGKHLLKTVYLFITSAPLVLRILSMACAAPLNDKIPYTSLRCRNVPACAEGFACSMQIAHLHRSPYRRRWVGEWAGTIGQIPLPRDR